MNHDWNPENVPDMSGKVVVVIGGNSGIGFECVRFFASKNARVVMASRSMERMEEATKKIKAENPNADVEPMQLDLASLKSVRRFSEEFKDRYDSLDILLNNAGIMMVPYGKTEDGFELQFGINHLGHFALTGLLIDLILSTHQSRVVTVSSLGHRRGKIDFDNLMYERGGYGSFRAYARSKLANLLFAYELQRRFERIGADSKSLAAHPGGSRTNLDRYLRGRLWYKLVRPFARFVFIQSPEMGALPLIRAATDPNVKGGEYFGPGGFMEQRGWPVRVDSSRLSKDEKLAKRLWEVSEELTGVRYLD